jgi:SAM-dependent methyltransferase
LRDCVDVRPGRTLGSPGSPETRLRVSPRATRVGGVPENYFDVWVAQRYEVLWRHLFDPQVIEPAVSFLAELAGDGRALELGIGTGRLALPLSRRGIRVAGIELSAAMVEQLHSQRGSADIDVTIGDFSTTRVNGTFTLAYLVRNTIMNLTTQDAQVECFLNVARHLETGGFFVIEVIVPPWQRLPPGETVIPFDVSPAHLGFDEVDVATQNSWSHHYWFVDGETKTFSAPFRNVWPSELDLMARLAGMALRSRWSDWNREPFTSTSRSHISVWQKPE